jgi:hypothetical protein
MNRTNDLTQTNTQTVARVFDSWSSASQAVDALRAEDFRDDQIGILSLDQKSGDVRQSNVRDGEIVDDGQKVASGVATGAAVGGAAGLLAALASLVIPGVGPIIAGGVLSTTLGTTLAGAGIGAAAGGLIGALTSLGFSEEDARYYEEGIRKGGTLVTVHDSSRLTDAVRVLEQFGGRTR